MPHTRRPVRFATQLLSALFIVFSLDASDLFIHDRRILVDQIDDVESIKIKFRIRQICLQVKLTRRRTGGMGIAD